MLIIGTAGIYSLASYAVVGAAAYGTTYMAIQLGLPWWTLPLIGCVIGLVFGVIIALPATRLDGFYYALLTLGVVELCRVYVLQSRELGSATGGLYGAPSYIPARLGQHRTVAARLLRIACRDDRPRCSCSASSMASGSGGCCAWRRKSARPLPRRRGVNYRARASRSSSSHRSRSASSAASMPPISAAPRPISSRFDTMLLSLAMLVIGGIGRAEGAVVGTLIVVFIDRVLIDLGPLRYILIGSHHAGRRAVPEQRPVRHQGPVPRLARQEEERARATRAEKGGEMLPEEATETAEQGHDLLSAVSTRCSATSSRA